MGQAKQRGTFEQRMSKAVVRNEQKRLDDLAEQWEIEKAMTPEQRAERKQKRLQAAQFLALAAGITYGS